MLAHLVISPTNSPPSWGCNFCGRLLLIISVGINADAPREDEIHTFEVTRPLEELDASS